MQNHGATDAWSAVSGQLKPRRRHIYTTLLVAVRPFARGTGAGGLSTAAAVEAPKRASSDAWTPGPAGASSPVLRQAERFKDAQLVHAGAVDPSTLSLSASAGAQAFFSCRSRRRAAHNATRGRHRERGRPGAAGHGMVTPVRFVAPAPRPPAPQACTGGGASASAPRKLSTKPMDAARTSRREAELEREPLVERRRRRRARPPRAKRRARLLQRISRPVRRDDAASCRRSGAAGPAAQVADAAAVAAEAAAAPPAAAPEPPRSRCRRSRPSARRPNPAVRRPREPAGRGLLYAKAEQKSSALGSYVPRRAWYAWLGRIGRTSREAPIRDPHPDSRESGRRSPRQECRLEPLDFDAHDEVAATRNSRRPSPWASARSLTDEPPRRRLAEAADPAPPAPAPSAFSSSSSSSPSSSSSSRPHSPSAASGAACLCQRREVEHVASWIATPSQRSGLYASSCVPSRPTQSVTSKSYCLPS